MKLRPCMRRGLRRTRVARDCFKITSIHPSPADRYDRAVIPVIIIPAHPQTPIRLLVFTLYFTVEDRPRDSLLTQRVQKVYGNQRSGKPDNVRY